MTSATIEPSAFPLQTLSSFGPRLNRLEFLLTGASRWDGVPIPPTPPQHDGNSQNSTNKFRPEDTIVSRLYELQRSLDQLKRKEEVQSILSIYEKHPDLFPPHTNLTPPTTTVYTPPQLPDTTTSLTLLASSFPLIHTVAAQLTALHDLSSSTSSSSFPPAHLSANLISAGPQVSQLADRNEQLARSVAELRTRTARLLERWVNVTVASGECWAEWEERVAGVEREWRRRERRAELQRMEDEGIGGVIEEETERKGKKKGKGKGTVLEKVEEEEEEEELKGPG